MLKEFLMKKVLKGKGIPEEQIDLVMKLVNNNPELFQKISIEVEHAMKEGKDQSQASMEVMMKYKEEIQKVLGQQ